MNHLVTPEEDGRTVYDILRRGMSVSYTALKRAKWSGGIRVNGEPAHTDRRVAAGEEVSIDWMAETPAYTPRPFALPVSVPWEDEHLMVVNKPAGLASQSSLNHPEDSLENALYTRAGCPEGYIFRPVNRLDKGTGGLMAVAKTAHAQHLLQTALHTSAFQRRYLALTDGIPPEREGTLDFPIGKAPGATVKRQVCPEGKPSVTRYRTLWTGDGRALVLLALETGRTHQIRVHLSHIGCPVRGDFLYGTERPEEYPGCFALQSAALRLKHPLTGEWLRIHALPAWAGEVEPAVLFVDFH